MKLTNKSSASNFKPAGEPDSRQQAADDVQTQSLDARKPSPNQQALQYNTDRKLSSQQQSIQDHSFQSAIQLMPTIGELTRGEIVEGVVAYLKATYDLDTPQAKQILGKKRLLGNTDTFASIKAFVDSQLTAEEVEAYFGAVERSAKADALGEETEVATASIIGGEVNRGTGGRDVEWRMMPRSDLAALKGELDIEVGKHTDQEFFDNWKAVLRAKPEMSGVLSTPIDAYSSTTLALAGGLSKFEHGTNNLTATAADRVNQLIMLCGLLEYEPLLVFNEAVSCDQAQAVADTYGVDVEHLGEPH